MINKSFFDKRDINTAIKIFQNILSSENLNKYPSANFDKNEITTYLMIDPEGWLPVLMISSDEYSLINDGTRIWECGYYVDRNNCLEAIAVKDFDKMNEEDLQKYRKYKVSEKSDEILYSFCKAALLNMLYLKDNKIAINKINSDYFRGIKNEIPDGFYLPVLDKKYIKYKRIRDFTKNYYSIIKELSPSVVSSMSLDGGDSEK